MATMHIKKLEELKKKKKALQEKEDEIRQKLTLEIANLLIDAQDFDHIEFDIIAGGMLDVIEKANQGDKITEVWKEAGRKFFGQKGKRKAKIQKQRNSKSATAVKKNKDRAEQE